MLSEKQFIIRLQKAVERELMDSRDDVNIIIKDALEGFLRGNRQKERA